MNKVEEKFYLEIKEALDDYLNSFQQAMLKGEVDLSWSSAQA